MVWVHSSNHPKHLTAGLRRGFLPPSPGELAQAAMTSVTKHGRLLLADRHLGMLAGVHSLLKDLFDTVIMAADERSLLESALMFQPDFVIVDVSLSTEGGVNIARRLMDCLPRSRVLVLSIHDEPTVAGEMLAAGAAGFVLKRNAAKELVPAVRRVLEGGVYLSACKEQDRPNLHGRELQPPA